MEATALSRTAASTAPVPLAAAAECAAKEKRINESEEKTNQFKRIFTSNESIQTMHKSIAYLKGGKRLPSRGASTACGRTAAAP
jgi:hypothetical protein